MPIPKAELKRYRALVKTLESDLLKRAKAPGVADGLKVAWAAEKAASRTGAPLTTWTRRRSTQVAIAWILSTIFVRTLEDRGFLARRRIAGPGASDSEDLFTQLAPFLTARDYLLMVFRELSRLPGAADVFDPRHNPVWVLAPSAAGARALLDFFRVPGKKGEAPPAFDGEDTRFLGDLYQDLSEDVRKRYALLQTPEFVEEFILEQTLDPAIDTFGLAETKLIDPTCGSGHFLLGAFRSLFARWQEAEPGTEPALLALKALKQVHGTDLNPYAVAIARFRLTLEFLQAAGIDKIERAPRLKLNLAVADSLLHGVAGEQQRLSGAAGSGRAAWGDKLFALEDEDEALRILSERYEAVVGNPPYITEKDAKKRAKYRELYTSAAGKFALAAPFTERFFGLGRQGGWVGFINANSFTKRGFGKALIQGVLSDLDVRKLVDTSGAYIPGHGTPTLLLFGRNQPPGNDDVVAVLGKRGEASEPPMPARAPVWQEIVDRHSDVGFDGIHVSVEAIPRVEMNQHPWVLTGGGARRLKGLIESGHPVLSTKMANIGVDAITRASDLLDLSAGEYARQGVASDVLLPYQLGDGVRDWGSSVAVMTAVPYDRETWELRPAEDYGGLARFLWPHRFWLAQRFVSGGTRMSEVGLPHHAIPQLPGHKHFGPLRITFAEVATHNHFALERTGKVYKQTAPLIKLTTEHDEDQTLGLLGLLNSSVGCLWMKLVFFCKGGGGVNEGLRGEAWARFYQIDSTKMKTFPCVDSERPAAYARCLDTLANSRMTDSVRAVLSRQAWTSTNELTATLEARRSRDWEAFGSMVAVQEELDWLCYELYGIHTGLEVLAPDSLPGVLPSHRPFELLMAESQDRSTWFERHGWAATGQLPAAYPSHYSELVLARQRAISGSKWLSLVEQPNYKRRWYRPNYDAMETKALGTWLLDRIESLLEASTETLSARRLAAELNRDPKALAVAEVYTGESSPDLESLVIKLLKTEGVPYLAAQRYKTTGLEKRTEWEKVWKQQRDEDAGNEVDNIPVPPKYSTKDFARGEYWKHRGKLDVPKERFVLYPDASSESDDSPLAGWAGWDHLGKAQALAALYQARKTEDGWTGEQLLPLLAGLDELVPWLIQWHNEPSDAFGGLKLGDYFAGFVDTEARHWGIAPNEIKELNAHAGGPEETG